MKEINLVLLILVSNKMLNILRGIDFLPFIINGFYCQCVFSQVYSSLGQLVYERGYIFLLFRNWLFLEEMDLQIVV